MANLIKKKFIGNDQVDGSKILLENNQAFRVKKQDGSEKELFKLNASDELILSDAPRVTATGSETNSLQTKGQLDSAVAAEASIRATADAGLQSQIDALEAASEGDLSALQAEVDELETDLAAEVTARTNADTALGVRIDGVEEDITDANAAISDVVADLAAEVTRAMDAETLLDTAIQNEVTRAQAEEADIRVDFAAADSALQSAIDDEEAARIAADALLIPLSQKAANNGVATLDAGGKVPTSQLPSYVDDVLEYSNLAGFPVTGETGKIYVAIDTGKCYRWSGSAYVYITSGAVDSVNGKTGVAVIDSGDIFMEDGTTTIESKLNSLQGEIDAEETARASADTTLQDNITTVANNLASEVTARTNADTALQGEIDAVEGDVADHETRISALEGGASIPLWSKGKKALVSGDITNGYIDLAHEIVAGSLSLNVDRLAIHEGAAEDYTLSVVGGVTRVTFINSMVSPGNEALSAGDNIYFKYQY